MYQKMQNAQEITQEKTEEMHAGTSHRAQRVSVSLDTNSLISDDMPLFRTSMAQGKQSSLRVVIIIKQRLREIKFFFISLNPLLYYRHKLP